MFRRHFRGYIETPLLELNHKVNQSYLEYTKAINHHSRNPQNYINRGMIYFYQNKLDLALNDLNNAITINSNNPLAYTCRGLIYRAKGDLTKAINDFTKTIQISKKIDQYIQCNVDECLSEEMKEIDWNVGFTYTIRGMSYFRQKNIALAIDDLKKALKLTPGHYLAQKNLVNILSDNKNDYSTVSKPTLFKAIKKLPATTQKTLLENCLYQDNPLGNRIWVTEFPYTGCAYSRGTLKKILDHLKTLDPNFKLQIGFRSFNCILDVVDDVGKDNSVVHNLYRQL